MAAGGPLETVADLLRMAGRYNTVSDDLTSEERASVENLPDMLRDQVQKIAPLMPLSTSRALYLG